MHVKLLLASLLCGTLLLAIGCDSRGMEGGDPPPTEPPPPSDGVLREAADVPVGLGINADLMLNNSAYASIVESQFDAVTFEYDMKQQAIVQSDGRFEYGAADQLVQRSEDLGVDVFGHTLVWHKGNNGDYLRLLVSGGEGSSAQDSTAVDDFMEDYITTTMTRYADAVVGWDVVNEPLEDGTGQLRTDRTPGTPTEGDAFYWMKYLGEGYIAQAFRYAEAANPDVPLFINDYNLESDPAKLSAMVALLDRLKEEGVPIDGVGTQMHISLETSRDGIDQAFQALAATGLMVRVSELDVRINPDDIVGFEPTQQRLERQQGMYNYVVGSYLQHVPEDQRGGVTVWNLTDASSWIVRIQERNDFPTLYDADYNAKLAYIGFLRGLEGEALTDDGE